MSADPKETPADRLHNSARRRGFILRKDTAESRSVNHRGGWMIIDALLNSIVAGQNFDLTLEQVEKFLSK